MVREVYVNGPFWGEDLSLLGIWWSGGSNFCWVHFFKRLLTPRDGQGIGTRQVEGLR